MLYINFLAYYTMDSFIFVGTNFRGFNEKDTLAEFKISDFSIYLHNSYRESLFHWNWNSSIGPSTRTRKIGTPGKIKPFTVYLYAFFHKRFFD